MDHRAIMDYYNHRPVTRDEFQEFLKNPQIPHEDTRPFHRLLQRIPEDQRKHCLKLMTVFVTLILTEILKVPDFTLVAGGS